MTGIRSDLLNAGIALAILVDYNLLRHSPDEAVQLLLRLGLVLGLACIWVAARWQRSTYWTLAAAFLTVIYLPNVLLPPASAEGFFGRLMS